MNEQTLGSYVLEERFAVGGMAEIFRARRVGPGGFEKRVAIKRLLPDLSRDPAFVEMFLEEARLASQVGSPNLVQVFDFGQADGSYFLAMELVEGLDLAALLAAAGALPPDLAVWVACELCRGLEALHAATGNDGAPLGVVHRDVTPGNALVSLRGEVKLGDFGIAKARARGLRTERGSIKGKLAYLSPEQARGDEVDARTDLYGVGLIAFELLTGERFLPDASEAQLLALAARPPWRAPSSLRPELPPALDELLRRALAASPGERFPDARQLRLALGRACVAAGDPAARLGELVRRAREGRAVPSSSAMPPPVVPAAAVPPPIAPSGPRTERLAAPAVRSSRRLAAVGAAVVASGAIGAGLWSASRAPAARSEPVREALPEVVAVAVAPPVPAASVEPAPEPLPPAEPPAAPRLAKSAPRAAGPKAPPAPVPAVAAVPVTVDPEPAAPVVAEPLPVAGPELRAALDATAALLPGRGLLAEDAPELFAGCDELRRAVEGGRAGAAEIEALRGRIAAFRIDRAFIERKLDRLQRRIDAEALPASSRQEFLRLSQAALSQVVTGNYDRANLELNALAALVVR